VMTAAIHSEAVNASAILAVAPFIPRHLTKRYWLHTGLIALMVLLTYDLTQFRFTGSRPAAAGADRGHPHRLRHRLCRHRGGVPADARSATDAYRRKARRRQIRHRLSLRDKRTRPLPLWTFARGMLE
jgi:hypothetical protein